MIRRRNRKRIRRWRGRRSWQYSWMKTCSMYKTTLTCGVKFDYMWTIGCWSTLTIVGVPRRRPQRWRCSVNYRWTDLMKEKGSWRQPRIIYYKKRRRNCSSTKSPSVLVKADYWSMVPIEPMVPRLHVLFFSFRTSDCQLLHPQQV